MKTLQKGNPRVGWAKEMECTGGGNGGGGCHAKLLVEQGDLFRTESHCRDETDYYTTFRCQECGVLTDVTGVPSAIVASLLYVREWCVGKGLVWRNGVIREDR